MAPKPITAKRTIVCIPGLGGHPSVFKGYAELLSDYNLRYVDLVDWEKTLAEIKEITKKEGKVIFLCSCYGIQLALRVIEEMPNAVTHVIVVEPFFTEFKLLQPVAKVVSEWIIKFLKWTDALGLRRKKFIKNIDYTKFGKYPIFVQPLFDFAWQNLTDYFIKWNDIIVFKLPKRVETKTLLVLSPKGFIRSKKIEQKLGEIFVKGDIVKIPRNGHNIITNSQELVAGQIRKWLTKDE